MQTYFLTVTNASKIGFGRLFMKITRMIQFFEGAVVKNPLKHFSIRQVKVV